MSDKKQAPESKKPESHSHKEKGGGPSVSGCTAQSCKREGSRFGFCSEHYEHFKFGLITKAGKPVSDYEKKFGHYQSYVESQKTRKVA